MERPRLVSKFSGSPYWTVTVKVELDLTDPTRRQARAGVAVMVAVDVGLVVGLVDVPPQPEIKPKPAKSTTNSRSMCSRLRFLKPRKQNATARVAGKRGLKA